MEEQKKRLFNKRKEIDDRIAKRLEMIMELDKEKKNKKIKRKKIIKKNLKKKKKEEKKKKKKKVKLK